jgi:alpha-tubulin suppressor-like RCC1 family protein
MFLKFVEISAGGSFNADVAGQATHTCGLTAAGAAYCWGLGTAGQLGNGGNTSSNVPVRVSGGHRFTSIAAGLNHTCGVANGVALCWGSDESGQLGNDPALTNSDVPVVVAGAHTFTSLAGGAWHSCGLRNDKAVLCWGDDDAGQLGNDAAFTDSPVPVVVAGSPATHAFVSVNAGHAHTCGVTPGGAALCWGWDAYGQLGDGGPGGGAGGQSGIPVIVAGSTTPDGALISVNGGTYHTCGFRAADKRALCWGYNGQGQLGTGTGDVTSPTPVLGGLTFAALDAGARHACAITTDGAAVCWGMNNYGQLGRNNLDNAGTPVFVVGGLSFLSVSAGEVHTCGLTATGAYCWGRNDEGQLGDSSNVTTWVPIRVRGAR